MTSELRAETVAARLPLEENNRGATVANDPSDDKIWGRDRGGNHDARRCTIG